VLFLSQQLPNWNEARFFWFSEPLDAPHLFDPLLSMLPVVFLVCAVRLRMPKRKGMAQQILPSNASWELLRCNAARPAFLTSILVKDPCMWV
jgi:hypothetical protein